MLDWRVMSMVKSWFPCKSLRLYFFFLLSSFFSLSSFFLFVVCCLFISEWVVNGCVEGDCE